MFRNVLNVTKNVFTQSIAGTSCLLQQTRNTFILKRRNPLPLAKKNQKRHPLRGRHFVYDLIEDTQAKKKPNLELVLTTFVDGYGKKGDVVSVKPRKGYNELLLPGLATYSTPENIEKYRPKEGEVVQEEEKHSSAHAERTVNVIQKRTIALVMNKDHPWKVEKWHIRASLRKAGIFATDEAIELPKEPITGPDLHKQNKEFCCTITINNCEKAIARFRIHHWSTDPSERLPYVLDHWKSPAEPLFGDSSPPTDSKNVTN